MKLKPSREPTIYVSKKLLYLNVDFKGDTLADILKKKIYNATKTSFLKANLEIVFVS